MKKLDEDAIIRIFQKKFGNMHVSEDVETLDFSGQKIFAKTDTLVQSTDIPAKMGLKDAARKSMVSCTSDFAAKGIRPRYATISVNLPRSVSRRQVADIAAGFRQASREFGFSILGGDTNQGKEFVFNVCMFGAAKKIIARGGSKRGDLVFVTGPFGYTPVGLSALQGRSKSSKITKRSVAAMLRPRPKLDFALAAKRHITSAMDSSDGLSITLNVMASQSKNKFVITEIPARKDIRDHAGTARQLVDWVFYGGEEYEFAFTINPGSKKRITEIARSLKTPIIQIGFVVQGSGVELDKMVLKGRGWRHFA